MAIQDEITVFPFSKAIRHTSGTTVWSVTAMYSLLQDWSDEPGRMSYETIIKFNTPTSFTMLNGWYLDDGDGSNILQYLTGAGIDTLNYDTIADPVYQMDIDTEVTEVDANDLDSIVSDDATPVGPLLSYKANYPTAGQARIVFRDTRTTPAIPASGSAMTTAAGMSYTNTGGAIARSGDYIYHNVFTLASFPGTPDPQVYMYQLHPSEFDTSRIRISEWSQNTNWDRGTIDVLIPVQEAGDLIDSGNINTLVRQTGDLFTFVESTFNTAGRTPIATETTADGANVSTGEHYLFYNGGTSPTITAGDVIQDVATGTTKPGWYAEVVSHTSWSAATGYIEIRGLNGVPADTDNIFIGASDTTANVNGSVGDTLLTYDAETTTPVAGDIGDVMAGGTSGAERVLRAYQDDGTTGKLLGQVYHAHGTFDSQTYTGAGRNELYKQFVDNDAITMPGAGLMAVTLDAAGTTLTSGFSDIEVIHVNGTAAHGGTTGTFTPGERVTWTGGGVGFMILDDGSDITLGNIDESGSGVPINTDTITGDISGATCTVGAGGFTHANTEGFEFPLQTTGATYSVYISGGGIYEAGRSLAQVYNYLQFYVRDGQTTAEEVIYTSTGAAIVEIDPEEYIRSISSYTATKPAPFGTLAGTLFFGAQGVWVTQLGSGGDANLRLTDHGGTARAAFVSVNVNITNTRVDDRFLLTLEDPANLGRPLKDQYTSHATNNTIGTTEFDQDAAGGGFPNDTPVSGTFFVVDNALNKEHRYRYTSFDATGGSGDDGQFQLPAELTGTSDGSTASEILEDASENFSATVQVGDIIHRTSGSLGFCYVTDVTSAASGILGTTLLEDTSGTAAAAWTSGDTYAIHSLVKTYDGSDTFFVPYVDVVEDTGTDGSPGTYSVTLTYVSDRNVVFEARNVENTLYEIVSFPTTGTIDSGGLNQAIIRTEDTVFVPA